MGGIGKTTLAKRIFNDQRIHEEFQLKVWVCVSKEVKGIEILKCMIREIGGQYGDAKERSELVPLLKRLVKGKKFLLVLDDVWEESRDVWDGLLRVPMTDGAHGSRLVVTTRDGRVANGMKAAKSHQMNKLSEEDGWSLLVKQLAPNGVESEIKDLMEIGMQIIKKCDGLPIAIKSIGGVLCTKGNTRDNWEAILASHVWFMNGLSEDVHRAFYLSYEDLPSPLKQCFIFCSLYPEDFLFYQVDLIYMWQAEGFFKGKGNFWELGQLYYTELIARNLLEDTKSSFSWERCKMHDLLWSFARQLGKDENFFLREKQVLTKSDDSLKVRRLSIEGNDVVKVEVIKNEKGVRTLVLCNKRDVALHDLCKAAPKLRILDISKSNISSLPDSLFSLVHLRYLNVSETMLRTIPNSLGNLRNLECFYCTDCTELSHIPQSISNLRELRCLSFTNTKVKAIPMGLKNMEKLIGLYGFQPYKNSFEGFSSIDGLESLSQLIELRLVGLESVSDRNIAKRANLITKNKLRKLYLFYTLFSSEEQLSQTNEKKMSTEDVLNELCPPRSVNVIRISGYFGRYLPNWLNLGAAFPNLKYLTIVKCACFERLAPLGQLPNLDILQIYGAYSVVSVGEEFFWGDIQSRETVATSCLTKPAFPKLSKLYFLDMPNWKEWQWNKGQPAMPKLTKFYIIACPQLISLSEGFSHYVTSLERVNIKGADNLITIENLPTTKAIVISENPNLVRISNIPSISFISIKECPKLRTLENLKSLQRMQLVDFKMKALPDYLMTIMPQKLAIKCSEELFRDIATQGDTGSEWHKFKHIDKVMLSTLDKSLYATYQKTPFNFTTNINKRLLDDDNAAEASNQV
ncbi:putative disease resistance RPP13-like protein 1 isoform X2 [Carex rostrata]